MAHIQSIPTTGVHFDEWQSVRWTDDGIAEFPDQQQQVDEYLACQGNVILLRLFVERYGGEWRPEEVTASESV